VLELHCYGARSPEFLSGRWAIALSAMPRGFCLGEFQCGSGVAHECHGAGVGYLGRYVDIDLPADQRLAFAKADVFAQVAAVFKDVATARAGTATVGAAAAAVCRNRRRDVLRVSACDMTYPHVAG